MIDKPDHQTLGDFLDDATEKAVKAERAAIVAWLRNSYVPRGQDIADAIEAGRHHDVGIEIDDESECPGPNCWMCTGEACHQCYPGCEPPCDHDVIERHANAKEHAK